MEAIANSLTNELLKYVLLFDGVYFIVALIILKYGGETGKKIGKGMIVTIIIANIGLFFYKDFVNFFQRNKNW